MKLDPRKAEDFQAIAEDFGILKAWDMLIAAIQREVEKEGRFATDPRHRLQKELFNAKFQRIWLTHPNNPDRIAECVAA
jgi:hypothetical protein